MKITMKRLASLVMSGALALSISAPAFAANPTVANPAAYVAGSSTKITATYQEATIDVLVPGDTTAVIDPYGIGFKISKNDATAADVSFTGQIVTVPMAIYNQSDFDLDVSASAVATMNEGSLMKLATATTKANGDTPAATTKSAFVQLQVVTAPDAVAGDPATGGTAPDDDLKDKVIDACADDANWASADSITVGIKATPAQKVATLASATFDDDGDLTAYPAGSVALVRLTGDCVEDPKGGWVKATTGANATPGDGFVADITFSFKIAAAADEDEEAGG